MKTAEDMAHRDPLPPACGGEGLGMGGRKAGLARSSSPVPSGAAPDPTLPTASGGRAYDAIPVHFRQEIGA